MNRYTVITLFPELLHAFRDTGIVGRCRQRGLVAIETVNPRTYTHDRRATVDDTPYGGGPGMVMMAAPLRAAISAAREAAGAARVIYLSPQGRRFQQREVARLAACPHLVLVAGRYEGVDERLLERDIDEEWSVGDFVLSGGEVPAMLMIDAIVRTLPDALGDERSAQQDSFSDAWLDHPHYTRPEVLDGQAVPSVLLSGHHAAIDTWRRQQRIGRTWQRRPDLLPAAGLGGADQALLDAYRRDLEESSGD
ncbi:MAG: tRNA (guanosine(37)-N1)-methyltransferase TrmD [Proteobacteria bacterium]|nr:tRNA (guanosine(37)-N1)-methyltransferase TrmD [Pseudomonadota bacterium]